MRRVPRATSHGAQRFKLRVWITSRLWAQVMLGMVLGFGLGLLLSDATGLARAGDRRDARPVAGLPGQVFLGLIAMVLVPLIFASIVGGLTGAKSGGS
jgi:Na+/H+-dicarboxylate symporter